MNFVDKVISFKVENKLTDEDCARKLCVDINFIKNIELESKKLTEEEKQRILKIIDSKQKNKRNIKILDLVFRFLAMVMVLTVLMLSINENIDTRALIILLSIGLFCTSVTMLPKIEK